MLGGGWAGHTDHQGGSPVRMSGDMGAAHGGTTDSDPDTQAVMGCGGTGHVAHDLRAGTGI